jgi:hypothetical protein
MHPVANVFCVGVDEARPKTAQSAARRPCPAGCGREPATIGGASPSREIEGVSTLDDVDVFVESSPARSWWPFDSGHGWIVADRGVRWMRPVPG